MKIQLRYLCEDRDRLGNVRCYVRVPGRPKVRLRSMPGSEEFMKEYGVAVAQVPTGAPSPRRLATGSFGYLCNKYFASAEFSALDKSTQKWRRRVLLEVCDQHAEKPVALMEPRHIKKLRDEKRTMPVVANLRLKGLRALFRWAFETDEVERDPAREVPLLSHQSDGHHTWSDEEIEHYEAKHAIGTKARLALALLLYTACRREDAPRFSQHHFRNGRVRFTQAKNEDRAPIKIDIPIHPALAKVIAATPCEHVLLLVTRYGKPYSTNGFGNKMRQWCDEAGLRKCSAHGLRKAAAVRLAECGATAHEIMAVTGHKTLEEVERYTRAARQAQLADSAMGRLKSR